MLASRNGGRNTCLQVQGSFWMMLGQQNMIKGMIWIFSPSPF
jgi:hypothetical protein